MKRPTLREWLAEGPFSLTLSSGFFGFFAHAGVMTVLEDAGHLPARVSGSSAGALVGGVWASGVDGPSIRDALLTLERRDFWDPAPGFGLLRGRLFHERLEALLRARTFEACRVPLAVSVYDVFAGQTRVIDKGALALAIRASCTVPFLFQPTWHQGRPLLDGGIADRPGILGMPRGERVLFHHLASRSPWRAGDSEALSIPKRAGLLPLVLGELPRVGPFRLERGVVAFELARQKTRQALDETLPEASPS